MGESIAMDIFEINNIKLAFSKAAINYDTHAIFQKEIAEELLKNIRLPLTTRHSPPTTILDIGCGTGFLTHDLAKVFPKANIFGCDISHAMLKVASCKLQVARDKKIHLITADGGVLPCKSKTFDIITSNLTYQWLPNLGRAFSEAHRILKPEGVFMFSTLGTETLKELRCCYAEAADRFKKDGLPPFMNFADEQTIQSTMKSAGFKIISLERKEIIKTYPDMWTLLKAMKSIGAGNPFKEGDKSLARGSILKKMAEVYEEKFGVWSSELGVEIPHPTSYIPHPNHIYATYEVLFVYGKK